MSRRWLHTHLTDPYVRQAQVDGYLSRAAYKLLAIQNKDRFMTTAATVLDLGAAPGGWSQVARAVVGARGQVFAVDRLPMDTLSALSGITVIQGDFCTQETWDRLMAILNNRRVQVVLSDMAPNLSGHKSIDQPRAMHLVELAWDCAKRVLCPGGHLLVKIFHGEGVDALIQSLRPCFKTLRFRKPDASRVHSRESYLLARGFVGLNSEAKG